ncbi:MAG: efflux transporter outer membrane subunit [Gammaproteobacteria bacterium]|nr:MAG: efflux transporter outer membrane subunit [Gammaproteobacteria bacterium]
MRRVGLCLALLLGGCAVGPDYHRPALAVPDAYRDTPAPAGDSVGDTTWWNVYEDPKLRYLISTAIRSNFDLKTAVARIDEAHAVLGQTRLELLPTLDARGSVSRAKTSSNVLFPAAPRIRNTEEVAGTVSYELDFWGRLRRSSESARARLLSSEYAKRSVAVTLVADVASAYFTLLSLDSQLEITKRTVGTREKFVELTHAQHDRGYATGLDVATAEAQAAAARANVPDLERRIGQTEDQLCVLLGENPHPIDRQRRGEEMPAVPPLPPAGLPSQLLERRPDVREAEEALRAANADIGVAKAALFPTISLTGLAGSLSAPLGNLFKAPTAEWSAAASAVQPLLDSQRSLYQVELADARKREALFQYEKTVQTAFQEVADALLAYRKFGEFEREQITEVEALRRAEAIALARYRIGYASYFDVINADRDLFGAELTLSEAYANSLTALVRLYQVLGGGWQDVSEAK